jgi:hypothetical protein
MTAPVDIVNLAADAVGSRARCSSINPSDGSQLGDVGSRQYQIRLDAFSRAAYWNCLRRQSTLTVLKAAVGTPENPSDSTPLAQPPRPFRYQYALPSNFLAARFIPALYDDIGPNPPITTNQTNAPWRGEAQAAIPFRIMIVKNDQDQEIKVLCTDWQSAELVYTARIANCDLWDSQFTTGFIAALASYLVMPLNASAQVMQVCIMQAKSTLDDARRSDGNEGPSSVDHVPDFIQARWGGWGGAYWDGGDTSGGYGWSSFVFGDGAAY